MRHVRGSLAAFRLAAFTGAIVLAAGFAVVGTAGSASAATCYAWSCHGHDPVVYGCSASSTVTAGAYVNGVRLATLQNRYAGNCKANWGRAQLTTAGLNAHDSIIVDITTTDSHNPPIFESMCYPVYPPDNNAGLPDESCAGYAYGGNQWIFTDMTDGTNTTTADVFVYNSSGIPIASASASQ